MTDARAVPFSADSIRLRFPPLLPSLGATLVCTALLLPLTRGLIDFSIAGLSWFLLGICLTIALGVARSTHGFTGTVGLLFLTTLVFNMGRPLAWLFTQEDRIYELNFGISFSGAAQDHTALLVFWCSGIAGFFGGYFIRYREVTRPSARLSHRTRQFCAFAFWIVTAAVCILAPVAMSQRIQAFSAGGYSSLYSNQTEYIFSWLRLADFLTPLVFALAILLKDRRYLRWAAACILLYVVSGIVVGERAAAGQWVLAAIWYVSVVAGKKINRWFLAAGGFAAILLSQVIVNLREGADDAVTLLQFAVDQGITFMLPELAQQVPSPPFHTLVASIFPLGALYSVLHIGSAQTQSIGNYLSSQMNQQHFLEGFGLGGNFQLEIYLLCGRVLVIYAAACVVAGLALRKWEEKAARSSRALFLLALSIPAILFLPRGTIASVASSLVYGGVVLGGLYILFQVLTHAVAGKAHTSVPTLRSQAPSMHGGTAQ